MTKKPNLTIAVKGPAGSQVDIVKTEKNLPSLITNKVTPSKKPKTVTRRSPVTPEMWKTPELSSGSQVGDATVSQNQPGAFSSSAPKMDLPSAETFPDPAKDQTSPLPSAPAQGQGESGILATPEDTAIPPVDIRKACATVMELQAQRRIALKQIIRIDNSARSLVARYLGFELSLPEAERAKIMKRAAEITKLAGAEVSLALDEETAAIVHAVTPF